MAKSEGDFQSELITELEELYPGSYVFKTGAEEVGIQGFPDVTILHSSGRWATLEAKRSEESHKQPNQDYYVNDMKNKSFSAFIYPGNKKEVLDELQRSLEPKRKPRATKRKPV